MANEPGGDLKRLYQQVILDHNRNPRNFGRPAESNRKAEGFNPVCGDQIAVHARVEGEAIADIGFEGSGCAIAMASASLMTERVKGASPGEAARLGERLTKMLQNPDDAGEDLGELIALSGVRHFPVRIKCAMLPWRTLQTALEGTAGSPVTTE